MSLAKGPGGMAGGSASGPLAVMVPCWRSLAVVLWKAHLSACSRDAASSQRPLVHCWVYLNIPPALQASPKLQL